MTTTDTNLNQLIINDISEAEYDTITANPDELYLTDGVIDSQDVINALGYRPLSQITAYMVNSALGYTAANNANIDGNWTMTAVQIVNGVSLNYNGNYSINLSSYLPNDNNLYEVQVTARATTTSTSGQASPVYLSISNYGADVRLAYAKSTGTVTYAYGSAFITVKSDTTIGLVRTTDFRGTADIWLLGYRKVR